MFAGETSARFKIRETETETETGYFFEKTDQTGVNFDWVELVRNGLIGSTSRSHIPRRAGLEDPSASSAWSPRSMRTRRLSSSGAIAESLVGNEMSGASSTRRPWSRVTGGSWSKIGTCSKA